MPEKVIGVKLTGVTEEGWDIMCKEIARILKEVMEQSDIIDIENDEYYCTMTMKSIAQ